MGAPIVGHIVLIKFADGVQLYHVVSCLIVGRVIINGDVDIATDQIAAASSQIPSSHGRTCNLRQSLGGNTGAVAAVLPRLRSILRGALAGKVSI